MQIQEEIQYSLSPAQTNDAGLNALSIFLAGAVLGLVMGLIFASYLIKIGRIGGFGKGSAQAAMMGKDTAEVLSKQQSSAISRKASESHFKQTNEASDAAQEETDRLL